MNYKTVREINANDWNINIFGVVKFFRPPTKIQKTGQYQMTITIIDESVGHDIETGIRCNIFDIEEGSLPRIKKVGDIILLKQMKVKLFSGRLQVQRTKTYQWVVFGTDKNSTGKNYITGKTSSTNVPVITTYDKQRIRELLDFLDNTKSKIMESENITSGESGNKITLLRDMKVNTYVDVIVQIIDVNEFVNSSAKALLLKVSDGTKVAFNSLYQMGNVKRKEVGDAEKATKECLCNISVFDDHVDVVEKLKVGDTVKITNLHVKAVNKELLRKWKEEMNIHGREDVPEWYELIVHSGTKFNRGIQVLVNDNPHITSLKDRIAMLIDSYHVKTVIDNMVQIIDEQDNRVHENTEMTKSHSLAEQPGPSGYCNINNNNESIKTTSRRILSEQSGPSTYSNKDEPRCLQESLTTTNFPLKPLTSITLLKHSKGAGNRFRLRAKVLCMMPNSFTDIIIGKCDNCTRICKPYHKQCNEIPLECPTCKEGLLILTYFFRLLLEDETGILEVLVCGGDALYFFNNTDPIVLARETAVMSKFEDRLRKFDNYKETIDISIVPSIDVCVITCEMSNVLKYWVFGTSLI